MQIVREEHFLIVVTQKLERVEDAPLEKFLETRGREIKLFTKLMPKLEVIMSAFQPS